MAERIAWEDTSVSVDKSMRDIHTCLKRLPNIDPSKGGINIPMDPLAEITTQFVIKDGEWFVPYTLSFHPLGVYERLLKEKSYSNRMRKTRIEYENQLKEQAPKTAARCALSLVKGIVENAISGSMKSSISLLPFMHIDNDGRRVLDEAAVQFNPANLKLLQGV